VAIRRLGFNEQIIGANEQVFDQRPERIDGPHGAALAGLDQGEFTKGHELDRNTGKQVSKSRLSQEKAKRLVAKSEAS